MQKYYSNRKNERIEKARQHNERMQKMYADEIEASAKGSKIFSSDTLNIIPAVGMRPTITLKKKTTEAALFDIPGKETACVLNFASFKHPGGGFLNGSMAQEEALCHASFLYNVLSQLEDFYAYNNEHMNRGLYHDRAIYSPDIRFFSGRWTRMADVITCAAPNRSMIKYGKFTEAENQQSLKNRILFIVNVLNAAQNPPEHVIFGAFGCGVFKQDPKMVAQIFHDVCPMLGKTKEVIFAVPDDKIKAFQEVFQ